jgi:hypothetical protein
MQHLMSITNSVTQSYVYKLTATTFTLIINFFKKKLDTIQTLHNGLDLNFSALRG